MVARLFGGCTEEAQTKDFMFYTYCLESNKNKKLYIGYTNNLKRRFVEHNDGKGGDFTMKNRPWKLIFYEAHANEYDARTMEKFYKTGYGKEILKDKLKNYFKKSKDSNNSEIV